MKLHHAGQVSQAFPVERINFTPLVAAQFKGVLVKLPRLISSLIFACGTVLLGASLAIAQNSNQFLEAANYSLAKVGEGTTVSVGDFNGDGEADLVTTGAGFAGSTGHLLAGNGNGTFQDASPLKYSNVPVGSAVHDFNKDGKLDIAFALYNGSVDILIGNGDGTFQPDVTYFVVQQHLEAVASADFNSDGNLDLAVDDGISVYLLFGNGDGTFLAPGTIAAGTAPSNVVTADLNNDGKADLVVGNGSTVSVLLGNGNGTFQPSLDKTAGGAILGLALTDLNNDHNVDVVALAGGVTTLLGNGDGTLRTHQDFLFISASRGIVVGDFNNDQKPDVAVIGLFVIDFLSGNGDGTLSEHQGYGGMTQTTAIAVGKFDANGTDDLAVTCYRDNQVSSVSVLLGNRDGTMHARRDLATSTDTYYDYIERTALADFNGDGKLDILGLKYYSHTPPGVFEIRLGNGDSTFQPPQEFSTGLNPLFVQVADMDGNSTVDVITANYSSTVSVAKGNGDGTFAQNADYSAGANPGGVAVGDINGDGKPDVIVTSKTNKVFSLLLNNGDGTLQGAVDFSSLGLPGPVAIADVNGDHKADVVVGASGGISIFLGNGDGTFQPRSDVVATNGVAALAVADMNGDKNPDIVTTSSSNIVGVFLGNGNGTFAKEIDTPITGAIGPGKNIVVADFNGDTKPDIAVASNNGSNSEKFSVLNGNGDGTFLPAVFYEAGYGPNDVSVGDVNGDGAPDLVVPATWIQVLPNTGGTRITIQSSNNPAHSGESVTFTATVKATVAGIGTPFGRVRFEDGKTILGTVALTNGVAQFTTNTLAVGNHRIDAVYQGNAKFNPHKSDVLVQQVSP